MVLQVSQGAQPKARKDVDMPSTLKDALSEATTGTNSSNNEDPGSQPSPAAGAEVPVTVHASRYSTAARGAGKLPPVHEETRTVIILPQGAVVRLSATVTQGELVVLTNNRTGADVICRVTSVKTQPGIQNYVHLEFTQRALDFWEEASTAGRGNSVGKSPVITTPATMPSTLPTSTAIASRNSPVQENRAPVAKIPPATMEAKSVSATSTRVTPLADLPTGNSPETDVDSSAAQSEISAPPVARAAFQKQPSAPTARTPRLQPFEPVISQSKSTSKTVVLFAIAAVVLLGIGVVAGSLLLRQDHGAISTEQLSNPQQSAPAAPPSVTSRSEAPVFNASGNANSPELPASASLRSPRPEAPLAQPAPAPAVVAPAKPEVQPKAVTRSNINVGKISAPRPKAAAQANSSEPPPVFTAEANAFPGLIGENVGNAGPRPNPMLPAGPAPPAPVKGGQLQQPKLLSSIAANYPPLARAQHVQGDVVIDALIDATGRIAATNVISGNALLRQQAIDTLRRWKYQPAMLNGQAIPIHINVTITFHLN
jgi:periplasmic protein TonB